MVLAILGMFLVAAVFIALLFSSVAKARDRNRKENKQLRKEVVRLSGVISDIETATDDYRDIDSVLATAIRTITRNLRNEQRKEIENS
jgi:uncharacterized MAPEG superfamily protein